MKKITSIALTALLVACMAAGFAPEEHSYAAANGVVKKGGYMYYYKSGKKVTNANVKIKGTWYHFSAKGRGFRSLLNKKGNKAMSKVIDNVKFTSKLSKKGKMKRCYQYIVKMSYLPTPEPDTSQSGWYYGEAKNMAYNKGGKCYGFASLTAVAARAMGYGNVKLHYGKARRKKSDKMTPHCWVTVGSKVLDASYDNSYRLRTGSSKLKFFFKTYDEIKKNPDNFKVEYKDKKIYKLK